MKRSVLLNSILTCILVGSIVFAYAVDIPVNIVTGPAEFPKEGYDPFLDVTSGIEGYPDGKIDMRDIGLLANRFGAQGNSTRNVTITNMVNGNGQPPGTYKDAVVIDALRWVDRYHQNAAELGVEIVPSESVDFPFIFSPKPVYARQINITGLWVTLYFSCWESDVTIQNLDIVINSNLTINLGGLGVYRPMIRSSAHYVGNKTELEVISPGLNLLQLTNIAVPYHMSVHMITLLIEYEYAI